MKLLILWMALICPAVVAFTSFNHAMVIQAQSAAATSRNRQVSALPPAFAEAQEDALVAFTTTTTTTTRSNALSNMAGLCTGLVTFASCAMAGEEIEMAELPPPYVPAIFAVGLLVGVGLLTGSLGNVIDEEASLGLQSGARARKEIERNKSSYFKKR